jgi:hypothetical protein
MIKKILIYFNILKNPIIIFIIKFEEYIFDIIYKYKKKSLIYIFYILFLFIINPIKIFFYKFYKILDLWRENKYNKIIINRMLGLILSILIFTNIIVFIKFILGISIWTLIYLYLLITSFLSSNFNKHERGNLNIYLKIFVEVPISTYNLVMIRSKNSMISLILDFNDVNEVVYYINYKNLYKVEKFRLYGTWLILNSIKDYKDKPSLWLYMEIWSLVFKYFIILGHYIHLEINTLNISDMNEIEFNGKLNNFSLTEYEKSKFLYFFDSKVAKFIIFLMLDLEFYLNDDIKKFIVVDTDWSILSLTFSDLGLDEKEFFEIIKTKKEFKIFNEDILIRMEPFLFYNKIYKKMNKDKNINMLSYEKLFKILPDFEVRESKRIRLYKIKNFDVLKEKVQYEKFIDNLYLEWVKIEDKKGWYDQMLKILEEDLKIIIRLADLK